PLTDCQPEPGLSKPVSATMLVPFISHRPIAPLVFWNRRPACPFGPKGWIERPCHAGPGFGRAASLTGVVPFISQTASVPLLFCHAISACPLNSPVLTACQDGSPTVIDTEDAMVVPFIRSII